jgi:endo-1,4-beta-D-glucanase Y
MSGSGGSGGVGATGGTMTSTTMALGPTPATATANFPFPQNRFSSNCTYPKKVNNEDVLAVYEQWKTDLVTSDGAGGFRRVKRPKEPGLPVNSTVSEGIAYGMLIAVYMNDSKLFDDLWQYALKYPSNAKSGTSDVSTILMNWYVNADGSLDTSTDGSCNCQKYIGAATDADEDMAFALIMASKQWGGQGSLSKSYEQYAKDLLDAIWNYEIYDGKLPRNGNRWGDWNSLNVSYFAPAFYRVFASFTGKPAWSTDVVKTVYDTIEANLTSANGNTLNGLVPAFSTSTGGEVSGQRHDYQYDSCRTPYRVGLDACLFNETRAKAYLAKTSQFFAGIGAANIKDGYSLNGSPTPEFGTTRGYGGLSAAFIGPAGVGAMHDSRYQTFVDEVWGLLRGNNQWCGGQYYDESWTMLSLLMMSGNFLDYTAIEPAK